MRFKMKSQFSPVNILIKIVLLILIQSARYIMLTCNPQVHGLKSVNPYRVEYFSSKFRFKSTMYTEETYFHI